MSGQSCDMDCGGVIDPVCTKDGKTYSEYTLLLFRKGLLRAWPNYELLVLCLSVSCLTPQVKGAIIFYQDGGCLFVKWTRVFCGGQRGD